MLIVGRSTLIVVFVDREVLAVVSISPKPSIPNSASHTRVNTHISSPQQTIRAKSSSEFRTNGKQFCMRNFKSAIGHATVHFLPVRAHLDVQLSHHIPPWCTLVNKVSVPTDWFHSTRWIAILRLLLEDTCGHPTVGIHFPGGASRRSRQRLQCCYLWGPTARAFRSTRRMRKAAFSTQMK